MKGYGLEPPIVRAAFEQVGIDVEYSFYPAASDAAERFTHHPNPLGISAHHVLFPRELSESESRLGLFNEGLQALKDSGEYQRILDDIMNN